MSDKASRVGRPRSEAARTAVLHAVDDLLVEEGYAAMSMKGIAARAGVSRQTVYRWWSTKAEILFEASVQDAQQELDVPTAESALDEIASYLEALARFLAHSPAGAAYRALIGEAQHDPEVAALIATRDVVAESAKDLIRRLLGIDRLSMSLDAACSRLVGPTYFRLMTGQSPDTLDLRAEARRVLSEVAAAPRASETSAPPRASSADGR